MTTAKRGDRDWDPDASLAAPGQPVVPNEAVRWDEEFDPADTEAEGHDVSAAKVLGDEDFWPLEGIAEAGHDPLPDRRLETEEWRGPGGTPGRGTPEPHPDESS